MNRRQALSQLFSVLSAVTGITLTGCRASAQTESRITLHARAPERGNWYPERAYVKRGQEVTVLVRNVDTVTHSFYLPAFGIDTRPIKPGDSKEVTITPEATGEYLYTCGIWCSDYHMYEKGYIVVED